jgi:hypothetical protein
MKAKSMYTVKLGKAVASAAKGSLRYHVISSLNGSWVVVPEGSVRSIKAFSSQRSARVFAQRHALSKQAHEVIIHAKDGSVKTRIAV